MDRGILHRIAQEHGIREGRAVNMHPLWLCALEHLVRLTERPLPVVHSGQMDEWLIRATRLYETLQEGFDDESAGVIK